MEFRNVVFLGGKKIRVPRSKARTKNKLYDPHLAPGRNETQATQNFTELLASFAAVPSLVGSRLHASTKLLSPSGKLGVEHILIELKFPSKNYSEMLNNQRELFLNTHTS